MHGIISILSRLFNCADIRAKITRALEKIYKKIHNLFSYFFLKRNFELYKNDFLTVFLQKNYVAYKM